MGAVRWHECPTSADACAERSGGGTHAKLRERVGNLGNLTGKFGNLDWHAEKARKSEACAVKPSAPYQSTEGEANVTRPEEQHVAERLSRRARRSAVAKLPRSALETNAHVPAAPYSRA